ncbi:NAD(P)-dependent oxidoreductase [Sphingobacterium sp. UBA5670]|uniref:NAD(P)-dependent oxidoreductase n=1 Tax=Sphingobacterium sp. UBA5670 TaxID=1947502 RepID=UPI0025E6EB2C|nr:SDR family oxidoreductase [Sphingobacterium sp. UBA5670]
MKIAIIGAAGGIGMHLVKQALADGHQVTGLVRNPDKLTVTHQNLTVIKGSAENADDIAKLVAGQDVICDCLGTKNVTKPQTMFSTSAENLAKVLKPEQLLIAVTGLGAGDSKGHCSWVYDNIFLPVVLKRQYDDKNRQEEIIKKKIARWIIVRPGFLSDGKHTGKYNAITELTGKHGARISREDVADFILAQARFPTFLGKTPMLVS